MIKPGMKYTAIKPAGSFGVIDGEQIDFKEVSLTIEVLMKPKTVMMDDGARRQAEPLPEHFCKAEWQLVKNLETFKHHWLFVPNYIFTPLL